jgi:hypothetical protein
MQDISNSEYLETRDNYNHLNNSFEQTLIFNVGINSGFFSEIGSMMECVIFCYLNKLRFCLYADDANFSMAGRGWNEFFESFCPESHHPLNKTFNQRQAPTPSQVITNAFPANILNSNNLDRWLFQLGRLRLLRAESAKHLTNDFFRIFTSAAFKKSFIQWPLFKMNGTVYPEIAKLFPYIMRYNQHTQEEINNIHHLLCLPSDYVSVQIRGGDKIDKLAKRSDYTHIGSASAALTYIRRIEQSGVNISNLFVMTDDYGYISALNQAHPEWTIYSLTRPEQRGYDQKSFNKLNWSHKRRELLDLMCSVEICRNSRFHFGYEASNINTMIKTVRGHSGYLPIFN